MQRPSSLLIIVFLAFTSAPAGAGGGQRARRPAAPARRVEHPPSIPPPTRTELMRSVQSVRFGRAAREKIYFRSEIMKRQMQEGRRPHAELVTDSPLVEMREVAPPRGATHAAYRVTYLRGGTLDGYLLVPQRSGEVAVERVSLRLRRGTTVVDLPGGGRIDLHWDGTSRLD